MSTGQLKIHSENILPIIKKWLYSDKDIFVRELVANACDAIRKLSILRDQGEASALDTDFRIDITINKDKRTLTFTDTGLGMTASEVEQYIAQIAFSSAEEFVEKYKGHNEKDQIIGHFGLGFYSAYMVADKVEINTLSYKGEEAAFWSCDGSSSYLIEKGTRKERGTEITLFLGKDEDEYLDESRLKKILTLYCLFLPYPIYLNGQKINIKDPLYIKSPSQCSKNDYLEFYRYLYPMEEEPLFWIHLNVDYPFHLKGILYFPKLRRDFDVRRHPLKLFCNRVFVSDDCKDILPEYLIMLRGIIDSPDIPLNVSRSTLQTDRTVRQVAGHIAKKVADSLSALYKNEHERFIECWPDVEWIVKLGAMEDEKFYERVKDFIVWKQLNDSWTTIEEYLSKNKEKTKDKVFYTVEQKGGSVFLDLYRNKGIDVLLANSPLDTHLMAFLERKMDNIHFQRIDAAVEDSLLDLSKEKKILDNEGRTEASRIADFIRKKLPDTQVEARSLASEELPAFITLDEQQRRMRDALRQRDSQGNTDFGQFAKPTFVVNTNSKLMNCLQKLEVLDPELTQELVRELYDLSLLSQREMEAHNLHEFIKRSNKLLERMTDRLLQGK